MTDQTNQIAESGATVLVTATLEYRDAEGNLLKTVPISTHLPLAAASSGDDHGLDL